MRPLTWFFLCYLAIAVPCLWAQDTDRDGLSDEVEQALLRQFAPQLMIDRADCAGIPAEFSRDAAAPKVKATNGTMYGQVFPVGESPSTVEIHYYHLWSRDCGAHGHGLDTEHVSVLVKASDTNLSSATWKAVYWFAAAHEDTVCDVSQIARASTLNAEEHGANVWVSTGKHASFFTGSAKRHGCGKDVLGQSRSVTATQIINLGEPGFPMNGSDWIASARWPLAAKMGRSDFPAPAITRLEELSSIEIAQANAGPHPAQGVIAISGTTADALENSRKSTAGAISSAMDSTGNSLQKSYRATVRSLSGPLNRASAILSGR